MAEPADRVATAGARLTIADRLAATKGRPAGFDYMRILLALTIVVWHVTVTTYGTDAQTRLVHGPTRPFWSALLPMFFALSGFLVSGSLERCRSLVSFLGLRLIRLVPALAVESVLAMLVLGPLFTALPLATYFSSPSFFAYALNIVGEIHFHLPGVFLDNPARGIVNGQLWTLPAELRCYGVLAIVALAGAYRNRFAMLAVCALFQIYMVHVILSPHVDNGLVDGRTLVLCFLFGSLLFRWRDHLPWNRALGIGSAIVMLVMLSRYETAQLAELPVAYFTVWLGLTDPRRNAFMSGGDYSYGIFLYGYPIQQAISALLPAYRVWWVSLPLAFPLILLLAWASWHFVERPALKLREGLKRIETRWLPIGHGMTSLVGRAMPPGLRARWVSDRARGPGDFRTVPPAGTHA